MTAPGATVIGEEPAKPVTARPTPAVGAAVMFVPLTAPPWSILELTATAILLNSTVRSAPLTSFSGLPEIRPSLDRKLVVTV